MLALALLCGGLVSTQGEERPGVAGVDLLAQASAEFERGKFDAALAILDAAEKQDLPKAKILDLRGSIYLEQGKLPEALAAFTAAHAADAAIYAPQLHLADTLLRQGKWSEARDAYLALMKATNILTVNERMRYGVLLANLGSKDEKGAQAALARLPFPTESPAYYYGQA
ncbi:MAG: tetratricopeptide repeat protein, partial [Chthoniobacterales bacterium]